MIAADGQQRFAGAAASTNLGLLCFLLADLPRPYISGQRIERNTAQHETSKEGAQLRTDSKLSVPAAMGVWSCKAGQEVQQLGQACEPVVCSALRTVWELHFSCSSSLLSIL